MLANLADIWNLVPISAFLVCCCLINYFQNNKKFLSIFRKNGLINPKESYSSGQLIQGAINAVIAIGWIFLYIFEIRFGVWSNIPIRTLGLAYLASDIMALINSKKLLQKATEYHHYGAIGLALMALCVDFESSTIGQLGASYCFTAAAAFSVNIYLSLKLYYNVNWLKDIAKYNYAATVSFNVFYHILNWESNLAGYIYLIIIAAPIWADVTLIRSLFRKEKLTEVL